MEKLCRALGSNKKELALWEKPSSLRGINQVLCHRLSGVDIDVDIMIAKI